MGGSSPNGLCDVLKYQIIYADPPWSYNDKMNDRKSFSVVGQYETQSIEWIKSIKVAEITDDNCALFLWAVSPLLPEAFEVITAWGFNYKTMAFCWVKETPLFNSVANLGRWTMGSVEVCLLATRGKPKRLNANIKQLVQDTRGQHSKKPDEVRRRIVTLMGDIPRVELFARQRFDGWDAWGNEVESDISL